MESRDGHQSENILHINAAHRTGMGKFVAAYNPCPKYIGEQDMLVVLLLGY